MPDRSPSDAIKPEVRAASAYTLKHVAAEVKLDQNENPYELPQEFKEEVARRQDEDAKREIELKKMKDEFDRKAEEQRKKIEAEEKANKK